nr:MAG TPA: hypothetical protein [Caudoviricetes sp.]
MGVFDGKLNSNEIFAALYNMIISQQVFADNIKDIKSTLVNMAKVDGSMYGDTKLYYSTDVLKSTAWGNDAESENLLALHRPKAPDCQKITLNVFRQISLTVDNYLSKRAWSTEGAFSDFNSVMLQWIRETKKVYDATTYNAFIGTAKSEKASENINVDVTTAIEGLTGEEKARVEGQVIAEAIANLLVDLTDVSRDFNDYGNLRSYDVSDLIFVWNAKAVSKIEKRDLPTIYHKEIVDKFAEHTLPARYFGSINTSATAGNGSTIRSLIEQDITGTDKKIYHVFAGDIIPTVCTAPANTSYTVDGSILFKVYHKGPNSVPYMSAFEVGTSFFNPKSLTENHYLTWGHNTLEYLKNYPFITVKQI